jgi:hypothetical protein
LNVTAPLGGTISPNGVGYQFASGLVESVSFVPSSGQSFNSWIITVPNLGNFYANPLSLTTNQSYVLTGYQTSGIDTYPITLTIHEPLNATTYNSTLVPVNCTTSTNGTNPVITYNVYFSNATWMYETNQTYTEPLNITISQNVTDARFCALAVNDEAVSSYQEVFFNVSIPAEPEPPPTATPIGGGGGGGTIGYVVHLSFIYQENNQSVANAKVNITGNIQYTDNQGQVSYYLAAGYYPIEVTVKNGSDTEIYHTAITVTQSETFTLMLSPVEQNIVAVVLVYADIFWLILIGGTIVLVYYVGKGKGSKSMTSAFNKRGH